MAAVDVIIPCYRHADFLPVCMASVLAQTGVDLRVLLVDDASPDETPAVAAALAAADPRVEFRAHTTNQGHIATFNEGLAWAEAEYALQISADDLLTPGALARAAALLDAHPEVGLVYGGVVTFTAGEALPAARLPAGSGRREIWPGLDWFSRACREAHTHLWSPEVMVRTRVQREVGGYRPELPQSADFELWLRFSLHAAVGVLLDADQAYYRLHPHNLHKTLAANPLLELRHRQAAFESVFREYAPRLAPHTAWRQAAARHLAREALVAAGAALEADPALAAALLAFAFETLPSAALTPEYAGLRLRRCLGPRAVPLLRAIGQRFFSLSRRPP